MKTLSQPTASPFRITKEHVGKKLTATCLKGDTKDPVLVEIFPFKDDHNFAHVRVSHRGFVDETKAPIALPFVHLAFPESVLKQRWEVQPHDGIRSFQDEN